MVRFYDWFIMACPALVLLRVMPFVPPTNALPFDIEKFLQEVERAARPLTTVRADAEVTIESVDGKRTDRMILLQQPNGDAYFEFENASFKLLILDNGARAFGASKGKVMPVPRGETILGSDFTREDLEPFVSARYLSPRIADENSRALTVTLVPRESQYSLVVTTFDREKKRIEKSLFYVETLNNLVKIRRDSEPVLLGQRWVPGQISMENLQLHTTTTFRLKWDQSFDARPELFDPENLSRPSGLKWP